MSTITTTQVDNIEFPAVVTSPVTGKSAITATQVENIEFPAVVTSPVTGKSAITAIQVENIEFPAVVTSAVTGKSAITAIQVENIEFPAVVTSPVTGKSYFLGGAGERGLTIEGNFIKFTAIGVYLEDVAVASLATKWKGKTSEELLETLDFYRDIISGPFEKLIRGSKIRELSGPEYSRKVNENCVAHLKSVGTYGDAEVEAMQKFVEAFKPINFPPGASVFYRQSPDGILGLSFSQDASIPEKEAAVIENKPASSAVLETMIGEHAVSPDLKRCLAARLPALLNEGTFKIE